MRVAFEKWKIGVVLTILVIILDDTFAAIYNIDSFTGVIGSTILAFGIFYIVGLVSTKLVKSNNELW